MNLKSLQSFVFPALALLIFSIFTSCSSTNVVPDALDEQILTLNLQTLPDIPEPADNPTTPEKIELGRMLFWDPIVSGEKDISCATCHHPDYGYADGLELPIGVGGVGLGTDRRLTRDGNLVPRNSPSVLNTAYNGMRDVGEAYDPADAVMFWDGRVSSLETQCTKPPASAIEMAGDAYGDCENCEIAMDSVVARLKDIQEYVQLFDHAFGGGADAVSEANFGKAIAAFERTLSPKNSRYDQYVTGDLNAISQQEKEGAILFFGKAQCGNCHHGPMFSDWNYYALGVEDHPDNPIGTDAGLDGAYKFRTPTLRNVSLTAPFMHSGMHATLEDVVVFYNEGVSRNENVTETPAIQPLGLSGEEVAQVVAFVETLTDDQTHS